MKPPAVDWFTASEAIKQYCENYESDCKFVKQELLDYLSSTTLK